MILRIVQDKALPFKLPILPKPKPIQKKEFDMSKFVTPAMQQHVAGGTPDHFGFRGYRAAIACLYARPEQLAFLIGRGLIDRTDAEIDNRSAHSPTLPAWQKRIPLSIQNGAFCWLFGNVFSRVFSYEGGALLQAGPRGR
jgi:hypothetical protein